MTPEQCRTARRALGWSERDLAVRALCAELTVKHFEAGHKRSFHSTVTSIRTALQVAGVEFTENDIQANHLRSNPDWTPEECHAGRRLLGWNCQRLGQRAGLTSSAVRRFERGARCRPDTVRALRVALEAAGIEFTNGDASAVRLIRADSSQGEGLSVFEEATAAEWRG